MKSTHNQNKPKAAGAVVISAVVMIGVYTLILSDIRPTENQVVSAQKTVSPTNAQGSEAAVITMDTPTQTATPSPYPSPSATAVPIVTPTLVPTPLPTTAPTPNPVPKTTPTPIPPGFTDGEYTATASYIVPRSSNSITVNVTIKNGFITSVTTTNEYSDDQSGHYINSFQSEISGAVVGKKINAANVSRLGGASLTSTAFNSSLFKIVSAAKP
jgi:uncharacterized protein with FMN-binding domain